MNSFVVPGLDARTLSFAQREPLVRRESLKVSGTGQSFNDTLLTTPPGLVDRD